MFKKGDLIKTNKYFNDDHLFCFILNEEYGNSLLLQVWCIKHKTIYYLWPKWCDLL